MRENQNSAPSAAAEKTRRIGIVLIACLLLVMSIAAIGWSYIDSKLSLIDYVDLGGDDGDTEGFSYDESALPEEGIHTDRNVKNILLLGTDERSEDLSEAARSDAMLILSLNKKTDAIRLISLERGMSVKLPDGRNDLLTHAFRYGGPKWVLDCVKVHFRLDIDSYVRVNFDIFEKLVDAVGGVDIELTDREASAMNGEINTNTLPLSRRVKAGMNHLDGFEALQYCRLRFIDSDWVRVERQRNTIKAIKDRCADMSLTELDDAVDKVLPLVQTNLKKGEIVSLMMSLPQFLDSEIEDMTIPAEGTFSSLGSVDFEANSRILREYIYGISGE